MSDNISDVRNEQRAARFQGLFDLLEEKSNACVFTEDEYSRLVDVGADVGAEQRSRRIELLKSACQEAGTTLEEAAGLVPYSENHWNAKWQHW